MNWISAIIGVVSPLISGTSRTDLAQEQKESNTAATIVFGIAFLAMLIWLIIIVRKKG